VQSNTDECGAKEWVSSRKQVTLSKKSEHGYNITGRRREGGKREARKWKRSAKVEEKGTKRYGKRKRKMGRSYIGDKTVSAMLSGEMAKLGGGGWRRKVVNETKGGR